MVLETDARLREAVDQVPSDGAACVEVSVVIPCLNEVIPIEACIKKAQLAFTRARHPGRNHCG